MLNRFRSCKTLADGIPGPGKSTVHHPKRKYRSGGTREANQPGLPIYSLALSRFMGTVPVKQTFRLGYTGEGKKKKKGKLWLGVF